MKTVTLAIGCTIMEAEAGWGVKPDGYMIAVSDEALDERVKELQSKNTPDYGWYEQRPQMRFHVAIKPEKIQELTEKKTIWVNNIEQIGELIKA